MAIVYISLGSNLGSKLLNLNRAIELLNQLAGVMKQKSTIYETPPWGFESFNNFLNQVVLLETNLNPKELLNTLLNIEHEMGRTRDSIGYQDRIIDLDILFYEQEIMKSEELEIPHPRLHQRTFMLAPMVELNPNFLHPVFGKSVSTLLKDLTKNQHI